MPRPSKERLIAQPPILDSFKPAGIQGRLLAKSNLSLDEFEAIRLADYEGLDQEQASAMMKISRPTFTRLIEKARKKVAEFLVEGRHLTIEGGTVHFQGNIFKCLDCNKLFETKICKTIESCPECESDNISNLAKGFGHGKCCNKKNRR